MPHVWILSRKRKNACFDLISFYYQLKSEEIGQIMKNFANQIFKNNVDLRNWLTEQRYVYVIFKTIQMAIKDNIKFLTNNSY